MKLGRLLGATVLLSSAVAFADGAPPPSANAPDANEQFHWQLGPKQIDLGHDVQLALPAGDAFLGMPEADRLLQKQGSFNNQGTLGVVVSADEKQGWEIVIDYDAAGYIKDNEKIDAPALLKSFREGTEEQNKQRAAHGFPALSIGDWTEMPRYDGATHRLIWALPASSTRGTTINYNTRVLGRRGYVSLDLLSSPEGIDAEKPNAAALLAATTFKNGARYEDFNSKTDKVAEYGLMGLILGGAGIAAVAKGGVLAGLLKVLVAGGKFIAAGVIALFAGLKRFFTGKPAAPPKETKLPPTGTDGNS
ncbi:MAG TPA: DUF2167 domain-containing protein [Polyangia bacterium]|nr:DUF2167 domain-containing protein [Polyangia bacterium]